MVSGLWTVKALKLAGASSDIFRMPESQELLEDKANFK